MTEFVTITGDILTVNTIVESTVALPPLRGHTGWGVIEALTPESTILPARAWVRDMNGIVRAIPLVVLRLHHKYPWCVVPEKVD